MKKIVFFPKYSAMGPSSRYRIYSYLPYFKSGNFEIEVSPLLGDWYLTSLWKHKNMLKVLPRIIYAYLSRILKILFLSSETVVYIGAELLPYFPGWMERYLKLRGIRYVMEFDDAVFLYYDNHRLKIVRLLYSRKFKHVIHNADAIICGCRYLADYAKKWNDRIYLIPTCINEDKYNVPLSNQNKYVVGWIGSSSSSKNINIVINSLKRLKDEMDYELHLVGFDEKYENVLQGLNYKIIQWSEETEIESMSKFTIGIMPLLDTPFARGKCAFKLVQYMAMGIPTISTPLQSNVDIDRQCGNMFADSDEEWYNAFKCLLKDEKLRAEIGARNKQVAMECYTFQATSDEKIRIINSLNK